MSSESSSSIAYDNVVMLKKSCKFDFIITAYEVTANFK
jgi:hypothetical protein